MAMTHDIQPRPTLNDLVAQLTASEDHLATADFDPEKLIGELRDKVDAIQAVLARMEAVEAFLRTIAKPILDKARAIGNNRDRLREYVTFTMRSQTMERLPGNTYAVRLRESPPALEMTRPATPQDLLDQPKYVKMRRQYIWDEARIKADLLSGALKPEELPTKLTIGHWPEFVIQVLEKLESKRKKK